MPKVREINLKLSRFIGLPEGQHVELFDTFFDAWKVYDTATLQPLRYTNAVEQRKIEEFRDRETLGIK